MPMVYPRGCLKFCFRHSGLVFSYHPILEGVFLLKWFGIRHHISDQLIIKMHFNVAKIRFSVASGRSAKVKWPNCCGSIVMLSGSLTQGPMLFG